MATTFHFRAVASDGKLRTGTVTADNDKSVARELKRQGLIPVYVGLEQKKGFDLQMPTFDRGKRRDVSVLHAGAFDAAQCRHSARSRAFDHGGADSDRRSFRSLVLDVLRVLKGGKSLADSLATHPAHFSELYINMVRAGEASGSLAQIFERLSEFERTRDDLRGYIISSLIYPALLTLVGIGSIFVLLNFVVPRFASIFSDPRMKIPTPTRCCSTRAGWCRPTGCAASIALAVAFVAFQAYIRTVAGRMWWDTFRLKLPLLGDALRKAETARFARAMATLVAASVPLVQSLGISRGILNNRRIAGSLEAIAQGVKRGEGIAAPLTARGRISAAGRASAGGRRRDRPSGHHVQSHGGYLRQRNPHGHPAIHLAV